MGDQNLSQSMQRLAQNVKDIAVGAADLRFDSRAGQIVHSDTTAAMFLGNCVTYALSHGDRPITIASILKL